MKAATHTEVYRPFNGTLRARPPRALTLAWSGIRIGFRKKLPALILFAIPTIWTIVTSFMVNLKFEAAAGTLTQYAPEEVRSQAQVAGMMLSGQLGEVESLILDLLRRMQFFVVLVMGWYGAGLIAEDKKLRANLLYFARPITRWTYLRGKLGTVCFWGACAVIVPIWIVCGVATFASPDWSFFTERWRTIVSLFAYGGVYVLFHGMLVLAISSVCDRRNRALAGLFGFYFISFFGAEAMALLFDGQGWRLMSIPRNFERVSEAIFGITNGQVDWGIEASLWVLGGFALLSLTILRNQTRKMELGQ